MTASTRFIVSVVFLMALAGCPEDSDPPAADGGPIAEDGGVDLGEVVYTTCDYGQPPARAACTFTAPCTRISDFYMGYCGNEIWECRAGRVVYTDERYMCRLPYGGVDAGTTMDGGHVASSDAATEAGPTSESGAP